VRKTPVIFKLPTVELNEFNYTGLSISLPKPSLNLNMSLRLVQPDLSSSLSYIKQSRQRPIRDNNILLIGPRVISPEWDYARSLKFGMVVTTIYKCFT